MPLTRTLLAASVVALLGAGWSTVACSSKGNSRVQRVGGASGSGAQAGEVDAAAGQDSGGIAAGGTGAGAPAVGGGSGGQSSGGQSSSGQSSGGQSSGGQSSGGQSSGGTAGGGGDGAAGEGGGGEGGDDPGCGNAARRCGGTCMPTSEQCSCIALGDICGPSFNQNCCARPLVPGGTFNRINDPLYPAAVTSFLLDRFEVTIGRFRSFFNAGQGTQETPPAPGSGKVRNNAADRGWESAWNVHLPVDSATLEAIVDTSCPPSGWQRAGGDSLPTPCINWYTMYAFCIWDGGRLPTEAEWNFAAAGGAGVSGQRYYPWSVPSTSQTLDNSYAVYQAAAPAAVGSRSPKGDGRWGHADMAGNMAEVVRDYTGTLPPCAGAQHDCINLTTNASDEAVMRGGYFTNFSTYHNESRSYQSKRNGWFAAGFRCAYDL